MAKLADQVENALNETRMLCAVGLLLAPGAFHQIVERGNDSARVIDFTSGIATLALRRRPGHPPTAPLFERDGLVRHRAAGPRLPSA